MPNFIQHSIIMAPLPLPDGQYIIRSDFNVDAVGNLGNNPPVQPVIRVKDPGVWTLKHVGVDQYLLKLGSFVTLPQGSHVESNRNPGVPGTKWIITEVKPDRYTIIDPKPGRKGWTLIPGPSTPGVVLEPVPYHNIKPTQLWHFQHLIRHSEGQEQEDSDSESEEEEEEK